MSVGRVLVTGAAGQLAGAIADVFADADVIALTKAELDIADAAAVRRVVAGVAPRVIVNCAAFNDVDGAEERPLDALRLNAFAVRTLARAAEDAQAVLVHYSTDFVFDGSATEPYVEDAPTSPRSVYASSKLLGEWFALEAPASYVLRVETLFGSRAWPGRPGTVDKLVEGLQQGRELPVFVDWTVTPSYIVDIAAATRHLLQSGAAAGLYHCVNAGPVTFEELARDAARALGVTPKLRAVRMADVPMKAARPKDCALSSEKLAGAGFVMPDWRDALRRWLAERSAATA